MPVPHVCKPEAVYGAIIVRDGEVLLTQREREPAAGMWHLPGGSPEPDEPMHKAVIREIDEETGLRDLRLVHRLPVAYTYAMYRHDGRDRHVHAHYLLFEARSGTPRALDGTIAVRWHGPGSARDLYRHGVLLDTSADAIEQALGWRLRSEE